MLVICPSRGRPTNIADLIDSWRETCADADLVVCVDDDDPHVEAYKELRQRQVAVIVGPRRSLGGWVNNAAVRFAERYAVLGVIGDDVRPRTLGWDKLIGAAMVPFGIVYGNDLHQRDALPTHPFFDAELVRRLGFIAPPGIDHLYLDNYWKALGEAIGTLTYLPGVVLEHMHPHAGKAAMDDGYQRVNSSAAYSAGRKAFRRYMATRFERDLEGLR